MNQGIKSVKLAVSIKPKKHSLTITRGKCHRFPPQYTFETRDDPSVFPVVCQFKLVW